MKKLVKKLEKNLKEKEKEIERLEKLPFSKEVVELSQQNDSLKSLVKALDTYLGHAPDCILTYWEGGEPIPGGGYRTKYMGKWYQNKPIDETPKCICGFTELKQQLDKVLGEK